ncbi:MAG: ProQ/FINO family protein [Arsenophonus sp.]|nr:MAG: ProQ/FINO family protein [Arsenophonus sp.]
MVNQIKLTNNKDIISFLANLFPNCFTINGEVRPLKIGILQDIAVVLTQKKKLLVKLACVMLYVCILLAYATYLLLKNVQNALI